MSFTERMGIEIPEPKIVVRNDAPADFRQSLYSRLENNTIKGIVGEIKKLYDFLEQ